MSRNYLLKQKKGTSMVLSISNFNLEAIEFSFLMVLKTKNNFGF